MYMYIITNKMCTYNIIYRSVLFYLFLVNIVCKFVHLTLVKKQYSSIDCSLRAFS